MLSLCRIRQMFDFAIALITEAKITFPESKKPVSWQSRKEELITPLEEYLNPKNENLVLYKNLSLINNTTAKIEEAFFLIPRNNVI